MTADFGAIGKIAAAIGAAIGLGAGVATGVANAKMDVVLSKLTAIESDVRMLKCVNGFPGDCPGQAKAP